MLSKNLRSYESTYVSKSDVTKIKLFQTTSVLPKYRIYVRKYISTSLDDRNKKECYRNRPKLFFVHTLLSYRYRSNFFLKTKIPNVLIKEFRRFGLSQNVIGSK